MTIIQIKDDFALYNEKTFNSAKVDIDIFNNYLTYNITISYGLTNVKFGGNLEITRETIIDNIDDNNYKRYLLSDIKLFLLRLIRNDNKRKIIDIENDLVVAFDLQ